MPQEEITDSKDEDDVQTIREIRESVITAKDHFTERLSSTIRIANFGLLGVIWTIFSTPEHPLNLQYKLFGVLPANAAFSISLVGIVISLFLEFIQYLAGYNREKRALRKIKEGLQSYDRIFEKELWFKLQQGCFNFKIILTVVNTFFFLLCVFVIFFER